MTNKPEVVMTLLGGEQLVRLSDYEALATECEKLQAEYEEELFQVRQDRDTHFGELMRAIEQVDALQAECEELRKVADQYRRLIELGEDFQWENIIRVDISDFPSRAAAIDAAMQGDKP